MNSIRKTIGLLLLTFFLSIPFVQAQQEGFIGEVKMFAGNFAPRGWAFCNGQLLSISQNTALFSIIGTTYGGDGRTTFALPDLRGRVAMGAGTGPGLSTRVEGHIPGAEYVVLNNLNLPAHNHIATVTGGGATTNIQLSTDNAIHETPEAGDVSATANYQDGLATKKVKAFGPATNPVNGQAITVNPPTVTVGMTGANQAFEIVQPSLVIQYIICVTGVFPSRN